MSNFSSSSAIVFNCPGDFPSPAGFYGSHHIHFICFSGGGSFSCDGADHIFGVDDLVILQGDSGCSGLVFSGDFSGKALAVPRGFLHNAHNGNVWSKSGFLQTKAHPVTHLDASEKELLLSDIAGIERRLDRTGDFGRQSLYHCFQVLMYDIWEIYDNKAVSSQLSGSDDAAFVFLRFQELLKAHCGSERTVAWYADKLNITPRKLSRVCLDASGVGASDWISHHTTIRVKEMLESSNMPIEEICDEMNFSSRSYFTRFVTKVLGSTPSEYRRAMRTRTQQE
ncbi:MAG: AraC family transcriptional regulator [Bacteroidales bacterium]|nr:AraC family transcriptional regulator [Bacteroidales bacterium]